MWKYTVEVNGMMCGMCEAHINDAVRKAFPVKKVNSSRSKKQTVVLSETELDAAALADAIRDMRLAKFKKSRTKRKGYLVKSCNTKIRKETLLRICLPFFAPKGNAITMQREKQSKALLSPVSRGAFFCT